MSDALAYVVPVLIFWSVVIAIIAAGFGGFLVWLFL